MSRDDSSAFEATSNLPSNSGRARPGALTRIQILFLVGLGLADTVFLWLGHYLAFVATRVGPEVVLGSFTEWLVLPALHLPLMLGIFAAQRMYQRRRLTGHLDEAVMILQVNGVLVLVLLAVLALFFPDINVYRRQVVFAWAFTSILITLGRILHTKIQWTAQSHGWGVDQVLIVGCGETARIILQRVMSTPKLGHVVVGTVCDHVGDDHPQEVPWLGPLSEIPLLIRSHGIGEVIVGMPEAQPAQLVRIINYCERERVGIRLLPDLFQIMAHEVTIGDLSGLPLLTVRDVALQGWKLGIKRAIDVVFSLLALILLSPFFLLNALLIKLESPGPVFYTQIRMGT